MVLRVYWSRPNTVHDTGARWGDIHYSMVSWRVMVLATATARHGNRHGHAMAFHGIPRTVKEFHDDAIGAP